MHSLTLSAFGLGATLALAAPAAQAQIYAAPPAVAVDTTQGATMAQTSLVDTVVSYVTDAAGNVTGLALSNGVVVLTPNTRVALGTPVRVDGLVDPNNPQIVYAATVYNQGGAVLVQPANTYTVGGYFPAYGAYAPRYYAPRVWRAPIVRNGYGPTVVAQPAMARPTVYARPVMAQPVVVAQPVRPMGPWGGRPAWGGGAHMGNRWGGGGFHGGRFHGGGFHGHR